MAEWLGGGLQNLIRRFDPALTPQTMKAIILNAFGDSTNFKLANLPDPVVRLPMRKDMGTQAYNNLLFGKKIVMTI